MHGRTPLAWGVFAVLLVVAPSSAADPEFNGRKMSEWTTMLKEDPVPRKRRAAVVALGQIAAAHKDEIPGILGSLGKALRTDAAPAVREQSAVAIGQLPVEHGVAAMMDLTESLRAEKEPAVKRELAVTLSRLGKLAKPAVTPLTAALKDADATVRAAAADALGRVGPDAQAAAPELLPLLRDPQKPVRLAAVFAVGRVDPEDPAPASAVLVGIVKADPDNELRREAVVSLGFLGDTSTPVVATVAAVLTDKTAEMRALAAATLAKFGPAVRGVERELTQAIRGDADKGVRLNAVRTLCSGFGTDAPSLIPLLTERLRDDPDFEVRVAIAEELGALGNAGKPAITALRVAQKDPQLKVREAATNAIKLIEKPPPKPKM